MYVCIYICIFIYVCFLHMYVYIYGLLDAVLRPKILGNRLSI